MFLHLNEKYQLKAYFKYTHPAVIKTTELVELFSSNHDCRQVRSVYGKEHYGKHGPHVRHESITKLSTHIIYNNTRRKLLPKVEHVETNVNLT